MNKQAAIDDAFFGSLFGGDFGKSSAEYMRESRARHKYNALDRREPEDPARRAHLERNPESWLRWYFPNVFTLPFSEGHRAIIDAILSTDSAGKDFVVAAPRGEGKTNILRFMSIYLVVTGRSRFPIMGGWQIRAASETFNTWCVAITSERLVADYPEYFAPFAESTHASRLSRLHWSDADAPTGAEIKSMKMQIVLPDGLGAFAAGSLQGDIKGMNITTKGGESLRPDKLLLDDPQDVDRAKDPIFVDSVLHKIDTQWLCLSGPSSRISMMVACTIFAPNDVGESLGKRRDSIFVRIPRVKTWPRDFDKADGPTRQLWDKWWDLYCDGSTRSQAFSFYRRYKHTMCDGFAVSWKYRFDAAKGDPDALFSAMVDYYKKGRDAFFSEYQNQPVSHNTSLYELKPRNVLERSCKLPPDVAPEDVTLTVLTTDINYSYGLTYEVAAFTKSRTCHVLAHGVWCEAPLPVSAKGTSVVQRQDAVKEALGKMAAWVEQQPWKLDMWLIDAGGEQFGTVTSFCRESKKSGGIARAIIGRAGKSYNPNTKTQFGRVRGKVYQCFTRDTGRWMCFDADYYKESAQTSWLAEIGLPGSASLFDGDHRDYADQMCREVLAAKGVLETRSGATVGVAYKWDSKPGKHDFLDCHAMAFAAAGWEGVFALDAPEASGGGAGGGRTTSGRNTRRVYNG